MYLENKKTKRNICIETRELMRYLLRSQLDVEIVERNSSRLFIKTTSEKVNSITNLVTYMSKIFASAEILHPPIDPNCYKEQPGAGALVLQFGFTSLLMTHSKLAVSVRVKQKTSKPEQNPTELEGQLAFVIDGNKSSVKKMKRIIEEIGRLQESKRLVVCTD